MNNYYTSDSLILTENGYKRILDVDKRDKVLSMDRKFHSVISLLGGLEKDVYKVSCFGGHILKVSGDCKLFVRKKVDGEFLSPEPMTLDEIMKNEMISNLYLGTTCNKIRGNGDWFDSFDLEEDIWEYLGLFSHLSIDVLEDVLYNVFLGEEYIEFLNERDVLDFAHLIVKGLKKPYKIIEKDGHLAVSIKDVYDKIFYEKGFVWFPIKEIEKIENNSLYGLLVKNDVPILVNGLICG